MGGLQATSSRSISIIVYVFIFSKRYLRITPAWPQPPQPEPRTSPACFLFAVWH